MDIDSRLKRLAASYLPEWSLSTDHPDGGSVLAMLIADMHAQSEKRFDSVLYKHKIEYLNMFEALLDERVESAKSYVQFKKTNGMDEPVNIPRHTKLIANSSDTDSRILFETCYGITATSAKLEAVYATNRKKDVITCLSETGRESFAAFDLSRKNIAEHTLMFGFDRLFDELSQWEDTLCIEFEALDKPAQENAVEVFSGDQARYVSLSPEGEFEFPAPTLQGNMQKLSLTGFVPKKTEFMGKERYVIGIRMLSLLPVALSGIRFHMSAADILPDEVICQGVSQNVDRVTPFGSPLEIYSECGIECGAVFARCGATITLSFELEHQMLEQTLPVMVSETELKFIIKKTSEPTKVQPVTIKPDVVLVEYLSTSGWKRLLKDEHTAALFNGNVKGKVELSFVCPDDMAPYEEANGYRLRFRMIRADNLYMVPSVQLCPVISDMRFSYRYTDGLSADAVVTNNHFTVQNITDELGKDKNVNLFYNILHDKQCMYLGFDTPPAGSPLSIYFEVENAADIPVDFTWEYLSGGEFLPLQVIDNTGGLLYCGTMLMPVPGDVSQAEMFGRKLYWLRMIDHSQVESGPKISSVSLNMVKVENRLTNSRSFYVDHAEKLVKLSLGERNIYSADVYVNEQQGEVKWQRRTHRSDRGRFYEIDMASGEIEICLNTVILNQDGPAVRVDYQSYQGKLANVPPNSIKSMYEPIKFISELSNPMAAYGGFDGYNEQTGAKMIENLLRTRNRAVSSQDYFDIISQVAYGVRRIKCQSGIDRFGNKAEDVITVALLLDEYEKGSHIFSAVKDTIRDKLIESSSIQPLGKRLVLSQPYFVRFSVRIWISIKDMENLYDLQTQTVEDIGEFIDPLTGGFNGEGWEIGTTPNAKQMLAYLKRKRPGIHVVRIVMVAAVGNTEIEVDDDVYHKIKNPFILAVNGEHRCYVELENRA